MLKTVLVRGASFEKSGKFSEAVYQTKCEAERNRFADVIGNDLHILMKCF